MIQCVELTMHLFECLTIHGIVSTPGSGHGMVCCCVRGALWDICMNSSIEAASFTTACLPTAEITLKCICVSLTYWSPSEWKFIAEFKYIVFIAVGQLYTKLEWWMGRIFEEKLIIEFFIEFCTFVHLSQNSGTFLQKWSYLVYFMPQGR